MSFQTRANDELGRVLGFGSAKYGELGPEFTENQQRPVELAGLGEVRSINAVHKTMTIDNAGVIAIKGEKVEIKVKMKYVTSTGHAHYAIDENDRLYSWGENASGMLGHGDLVGRNKPTIVAALTNSRIKQISGWSGWPEHMGGVACTTYDLRTFVWGKCNLGRFEMGRKVIPIELKEWGPVAHIERGENFALVQKADSLDLFAIGHNGCGQLGVDRDDENWPTSLARCDDLTRIDAVANKRIIKFKCGISSSVVLTSRDLFVLGCTSIGKSKFS